MIILLAIFLLETALLAQLLLLSGLAFAGLRAGFLAIILVTQIAALKSLRRSTDDTGERGALSLSAMVYAVSVAVPAWQTPPRTDVLLAAGFLLLLATLALDPAVLPAVSTPGRRTTPASHGQRLVLVFVAAAATLMLSVAGAPLLHATAGVAGDALPAIMNALRRAAPSPLRRDGAGGHGGSGGTLLYGIDAEPTHQVCAGVRDRGPHLPVVYIEPVGMRSLPLRTTQRLYVRVMTYDSYVDGFWITRARLQKVLRDEDDGLSDGRIAFGIPSGRPEPYTVYTPTLASGVLPMLPRVAAVHLPRVVQFPNEILASPVLTKADWLTFTAESAPVYWDDIPAGQAAPGRDNAFTWMQNGPLTDRLRAEALRIVPKGRDNPDAIAGVLAHLHASCAYSTDERPETGIHPVESFLFTTRKGHCELYATACALILRSMGIPCRFSLGYSGGTYDSSRRLYAFHADEYHAWVEVLLEKHGWVILDPTPADAAGVPAPPAKGKIDVDTAGFIGSDLADLIARTRLSGDATPVQSPGISFLPPALLRTVFWCATVLLAILVVISLWTSRRRRSLETAMAERRRKVRTGIAFFDAFCRHFARRGGPMRTHETPLEYLARLKNGGLAGDTFDESIVYFCDICFGVRPRDLAKEDRFLMQVRDAPG
jgi:transglutaminase-like putative cysteine protease